MKKARLTQGFSLQHLAVLAGISDAYCSQIENNVRYPSAPIAKKICTVLNKKFDDIFFIVNPNKSKTSNNSEN